MGKGLMMFPQEWRLVSVSIAAAVVLRLPERFDDRIGNVECGRWKE